MQINSNFYNATLDMAKLAASLLDAGKVVILPTDTIYAMAADSCNHNAVAAVYKIKQRPGDKFFPLLVGESSMASEYVEISKLSQNIMDKFWPGALTIVLPVVNDCAVAKNAYNGKDLAVRAPNDLFTRTVINLLGRPIVGTSANISGEDNLKTTESIGKVFSGKVDGIFIRDTMGCGEQSTIISVYNDEIQVIRKGAITAENLTQPFAERLSSY